MKKVLVVLSGGQDSTTCAINEKIVGFPTTTVEIHGITFDYGQKHQPEILAARDVARLLQFDSHRIVVVPDILRSTSPLVDPRSELEQYASFEEMDKIIGNRVEKTFVPMRNALFAVIAANHAVSIGADRIVMGVCEQDNANYPDCTPGFVQSMQETIRAALGPTHPPIILDAPLLHKSKAHALMELYAMGIVWFSILAFTHTAYDGSFPPSGADHATVLRAQSFKEAGLPDPLMIRAFMEMDEPLPDQENYKDEELVKLLINQIDEFTRFLRL